MNFVLVIFVSSSKRLQNLVTFRTAMLLDSLARTENNNASQLIVKHFGKMFTDLSPEVLRLLHPSLEELECIHFDLSA